MTSLLELFCDVDDFCKESKRVNDNNRGDCLLLSPC